MWRELENRSEISFSPVGRGLAPGSVACPPTSTHAPAGARLNGRLIGAGIVVGSVMESTLHSHARVALE